MKLSQSGFGHLVGMALVVVVFSAVGYIGYKLYAHPRNNSNSSAVAPITYTQKPATLDAAAAPQIKKTSDLDTAGNVLDQVGSIDTGSSDTAQLDSQLNSF